MRGLGAYVDFITVPQDPAVYGVNPDGSVHAFASTSEMLAAGGPTKPDGSPNWSAVRSVPRFPPTGTTYNLSAPWAITPPGVPVPAAPAPAMPTPAPAPVVAPAVPLPLPAAPPASIPNYLPAPSYYANYVTPAPASNGFDLSSIPTWAWIAAAGAGALFFMKK